MTEVDNPFQKMGMIRFWLLATLVYATFPLSLLCCWIFRGKRVTKQLIVALIEDFLQTIAIVLLLLGLLLWIIYYYVLPLFIG